MSRDLWTMQNIFKPKNILIFILMFAFAYPFPGLNPMYEIPEAEAAFRKVVFLTTADTTWTVPNDWNHAGSPRRLMNSSAPYSATIISIAWRDRLVMRSNSHLGHLPSSSPNVAIPRCIIKSSGERL